MLGSQEHTIFLIPNEEHNTTNDYHEEQVPSIETNKGNYSKIIKTHMVPITRTNSIKNTNTFHCEDIFYRKKLMRKKIVVIW